MNALSKRARAVLYALVTEFITTGEPVGSRTLTKRGGFPLSPATIRNVLSDLDDAGYLTQPHASAGRVPTAAAFRLFIDALMHERALGAGDVHRISDHFHELPRNADLLRETGRLLSDMSGAPALVARLHGDRRALIKIQFVRSRPLELLAVMIGADGMVENRFVALDHPIGDAELERLHNLLEDVVQGRTLADVRRALARAVVENEGEVTRLRRLAQTLLRSADTGIERHADVVIEGQSRLLDQPEFGSVEALRDLLRAFEDHERLLALIDEAILADRAQVFLGEEISRKFGCSISVVVARFRDEEGEPRGAVGVIGPQRMDYPFVVPLVGATADAMTAALARKRESG